MGSPERKKPFHNRVAEKLVASRFFTLSALIHAVVVILAGSAVLFKHYAELPDFAASDGGLVVDEGQAEAPPEQPPDFTEQTFQPPAPQIHAPTPNILSTTNPIALAFHASEAQPIIKAEPAETVKKALAQTVAGLPRGVARDLPATMAARAGGAARARAITMNGGNKESEAAVLRGLHWLANNQNEDGSWGPPGVRSAMTGFAMLSFLGHGETPASTAFGPTVQKALEWIVRNGAKFEGRLSMDTEFTRNGVYEHAITTYALGEYYTMTRDERVVDLLKHAVGYIVDGQSADGGWVYGYVKINPSSNKVFRGDTSVTGWHIQALKAAHLTGLNIPGVDEALDKAMLDLKRVQGPHGGFGYHDPEDRYSLTGVGVLCAYFWKQEKDKSVMDGIDYIMEETDKEYPVLYQGEKADLYAWYYNTQACLMVGGAAWTKWNRLFRNEITNAQAPDGSWPPMKSRPIATGPYQVEPLGPGPLYRTNLCILMLEVYYRYLPSTR